MPPNTKHKMRQVSGAYLSVIGSEAAEFGKTYFQESMPTVASIISQSKATASEVKELFKSTASEFNSIGKQYKKLPAFQRINNWFLGEESQYNTDNTDDSWDEGEVDNSTTIQLSEAAQNTNKLAKAVIESSHQQVLMQENQITANTKSIEKLTSVVNSGFNSINEKLGSILNVLTTNTARIIETNLATFNLSKKDEMIKKGKFDASAYIDVVKDNFSDMTGGISDILQSVMQDGLKSALNPKTILNLTFSSLTEKLVPNLKDTLKDIDKTISDTLLDAVIGLDRHRNDGGIAGILSQLLGVDTDKKKLDTSRPELELGATPYDTISKEALTNAIPGYLRKILVQLGGPDLVYDYRSRSFRTQKAITRQFEEDLTHNSGDNLKEAKWNVKKQFANSKNEKTDRMMYDVLINTLANMESSSERDDYLNSLKNSNNIQSEMLNLLQGVDLNKKDRKNIGNFSNTLYNALQDPSVIRSILIQGSKAAVVGGNNALASINKANGYNVDLSGIDPNNVNSSQIIAQQYGYKLSDTGKENKLEESLENVANIIGSYTNKALYEIYQRLETGLNVFVTGQREPGKGQRRPYSKIKGLKVPKDFTAATIPTDSSDESYTSTDDEDIFNDDEKNRLANGDTEDTFDRLTGNFGNRTKSAFNSLLHGDASGISKIITGTFKDLSGVAQEKISSGLEYINQSFGNVTGHLKYLLTGKGYSYQEEDPETGEMKTVTVEDKENGGVFGFVKNKFKNMFKGIKDNAKDWWKDVKSDFAGILPQDQTDPKTGKKTNNHSKMMKIITASVVGGTGGGLIGGPIGVLLGSIAGAGVGLSSTISDKIKEKLFGRDKETGEAKGIFTKIKDAVWLPIKFQMAKTAKYIGLKIRKNVTGPISDIMMAIKDRAVHHIDNMFQRFKKRAKEWATKHIFDPLKKVFKPVGNMLKKAGTTIIKGMFGLDVSVKGGLARAATTAATAPLGGLLKGLAKNLVKNNWKKLDFVTEDKYYLLKGEKYFDPQLKAELQKQNPQKEVRDDEAIREFSGKNDDRLVTTGGYTYIANVKDVDPYTYYGKGNPKIGPSAVLITEESYSAYPIEVNAKDYMKHRQKNRDIEVDMMTKYLKSPEFKQEYFAAQKRGYVGSIQDYAKDTIKDKEQQKEIIKEREDIKNTAENTKNLLDEIKRANEDQAEVNAKVTGEIIPGSSFKVHDQGTHDRLDRIIELYGGDIGESNSISDVLDTDNDLDLDEDLNDDTQKLKDISGVGDEDIEDIKNESEEADARRLKGRKLRQLSFGNSWVREEAPRGDLNSTLNAKNVAGVLDPADVIDSDKEVASSLLQSGINITTNDDGEINKDEKSALDKLIGSATGEKANVNESSSALKEIISDHSEDNNKIETEGKEKKETIWDKLLGGLTSMLGGDGILGGLKNLLVVGGALAIFFQNPEGLLNIFKNIGNAVGSLWKWITTGEGGLGEVLANLVGWDKEKGDLLPGTDIKRTETDAGGNQISHQGMNEIKDDVYNAAAVNTIQEIAPRAGGTEVKGPQSYAGKQAQKSLNNVREAVGDKGAMQSFTNSVSGRATLALGAGVVGKGAGALTENVLTSFTDDEGNQIVSDEVAGGIGRGVELVTTNKLAKDALKKGSNSKMAWIVEKVIEGCKALGKAVLKLLPDGSKSVISEFFTNLGNIISSKAKELGTKCIDGLDDILKKFGFSQGLKSLEKSLPVIGGVMGVLDGLLTPDHLFKGMPGMTTPQMYTASTIVQGAFGAISSTGVGSFFIIAIDVIDMLIDEMGGKCIKQMIAEFIVKILGGEEGLKESQEAFKAEKEYYEEKFPQTKGMSDAAFNDLVNPADTGDVIWKGYTKVGEDGHIEWNETGTNSRAGGLNKVLGVGTEVEYEKDAEGNLITGEDGNFRAKTDIFGNEIKSDEGFFDKVGKGFKQFGTSLFGGDTYLKDENGNDVLDENGERVVSGHVNSLWDRTWGKDAYTVNEDARQYMTEEQSAALDGKAKRVNNINNALKGGGLIDLFNKAKQNNITNESSTAESKSLEDKETDITELVQNVYGEDGISVLNSVKGGKLSFKGAIAKLKELEDSDSTVKEAAIKTFGEGGIEEYIKKKTGGSKTSSLMSVTSKGIIDFTKDVFGNKSNTNKTKTARKGKSETITNENGEKVTTVTYADGSKDVTTTRKDGSTYTTHYNEDGEVEIKMGEDMQSKNVGQWMSDKTANIFGPIIDTFNAMGKGAEEWNKDNAPWKNDKDSSVWFNDKVKNIWGIVLDPFESLTEKARKLKDSLNDQIDSINTDLGSISSIDGSGSFDSLDASGEIDSVDSYSENEDGQLVDKDGKIVYDSRGIPVSANKSSDTIGFNDDLNKRIGTRSNNDGTKTTTSYHGGSAPYYTETRELTTGGKLKTVKYTYPDGTVITKYYDKNGTLRRTNTKNSKGTNDIFYNSNGVKTTVDKMYDPLEEYLTKNKQNERGGYNAAGVPLAYATGDPGVLILPKGAPGDMQLFNGNPLSKDAGVTSQFGSPSVSGSHKGVDLIPADGTGNADVTSTVNGKIISVKRGVPDSITGLNYNGQHRSGNEVVIQGNDGFIYRNSHLKASSVPNNLKVGSPVAVGQTIGKVGSTGRSSGNHLHYEIGRMDSKGNFIPVNPSMKGANNKDMSMMRGGTGDPADISEGLNKVTGLVGNVASATKQTGSVSQSSSKLAEFQKWINICQSIKQQISAAYQTYGSTLYNQSGYMDVTANGFTAHTRRDCSGYASGCISCFAKKSYLGASGSMAGDVADIKNAGFTRMKFPGYDGLSQGDIMVAPNSHVEIFSHMENGVPQVWSFGSTKTGQIPGTSKYTPRNYTIIWRPNCSTGATVTPDGSFTGGSSMSSSSSSSSSGGVGGALGEIISGLTNIGYGFIENLTGLNFGGSAEDSSDASIVGVGGDMDAVAEGGASAMKGETVPIPDGLGTHNAYMGWQLITSKSSPQYKLREAAGMKFDGNGYGTINGRYVVATTTTYGNVGDYIDVKRADGKVLKAIIGDIKNPSDPGCNKWGHENGKCITEFVVNKPQWYASDGKGGQKGYAIMNQTYPGSDHSAVVSITNQGSFYENGGDPGDFDLSYNSSELNDFDFGGTGDPGDLNITNDYIGSTNIVKSNSTSGGTSISFSNRYKKSNITPKAIGVNTKKSANSYVVNPYNGSIIEAISKESDNNTTTPSREDKGKNIDALIRMVGEVYTVLCDIESNTSNSSASLTQLNEKEFKDSGVREGMKRISDAAKRKKTKYIPSTQGNISKILSMARP